MNNTSSFGENLLEWLRRYDYLHPEDAPHQAFDSLRATTVPATDKWSGQNVSMTIVELGNIVDSRRCQEVIDRARLLQHSDHAHLEPILDFQTDGGMRFVFTTSGKQGVMLDEVLRDETLADDVIVDLISQYISIHLYLEMHAPDAVPYFADETLTVLPPYSLYVRGYQLDFLFRPAPQPSLQSAAGFVERLLPFVNNKPLSGELSALVQEIMKPPEHPKINSIHKLRTTLKHLSEHAADKFTQPVTENA